MMVRFTSGDVVHYGFRIDTWPDPVVWLLCERKSIWHDVPPVYPLGVRVVRVYDDVNCMTCLVLGAQEESSQ